MWPLAEAGVSTTQQFWKIIVDVGNTDVILFP
jgi:hypothetical protein